MNAAEGKMAGKAKRTGKTSHKGNTREHVTKCTYEYGDKARRRDEGVRRVEFVTCAEWED